MRLALLTDRLFAYPLLASFVGGRTHARYYGATEGGSDDDVEREGLLSSPVRRPSASVYRARSTTVTRVLGILAYRFRRFRTGARFALTKAVFTSSPTVQYSLTSALILQSVFTKPLILLIVHVAPPTSLTFRVLHGLAPVPLIISMLSLIHLYFILSPLLHSIQATRKLVVIKAIVVMLALQLMAVSYLETTGRFAGAFDVSTYSVHKVRPVGAPRREARATTPSLLLLPLPPSPSPPPFPPLFQRSIRFYCLLSIVEMALLCPVFKATFSPDVFKCLKGSKVVRGLSPFSRAVEGANSEAARREEEAGEGARGDDGSLASFRNEGAGKAREGGEGREEFKKAKKCCDRR